MFGGIRIAGAIVLGVVLAAGGAAAKDKVTIGTNWVAEAEHGGLYEAASDGIYESYGLEVGIRPGGPQVNTAQMLAGGAYDFALISNSFVPVNMVKEGADYIAVAAIFQKDPSVLIAHSEMGFKSLEDLKGHPILLGANSWDTWWRFLKVKYGFSDDQGRRYTFNIAPFMADKTIIQQGFVTSEPYSIRAAGVEPQVFLLADYGYSSYSSLIMTSKKLVATNPALVQRFVDATIKGYHALLHGGGEKAMAGILKDNPDYTPQLFHDSVGAMLQYGIIESGDAATLGIGAMTDARWQSFFQANVEAGVYPADLDIHAAYTTRFVNKKVGL